MSLPRLDHSTHIADRLHELAEKVKTRSRASLTDANRLLETIAARFFNALFGWELVNLNAEQTNYPATDLGDRQRRLAIQVTNEHGSGKIKRTAAKAVEHRLGTDFDRLIIFFLLPKKPGFPKNFTQPPGGPLMETWDIADLLKQLQELADLDALAKAAKVLDQEMGKIAVTDIGPKFDISRILKYAPADLIGREAELRLLNDAWHGGAELPLSPDSTAAQQRRPTRPKVLTFVALGGEGKTSLVAKWVAELAAQDWPGCAAAFAWSFYSQGTREQQAASSDLFLKEALTFFGDEAMANSSQGAFEKGRRLAQLCGERRSLLILDGLEPLQYAPTAPTPGQLKDQGIAALLRALAAASHGLCVVTTRYSLPDLRAFWQTTASEVKLLRLSRDAGVHLLKTLGVRGTAQEFATLVEDVKGHALTLTLLGGFLKRAFHGDIRQRDRVKFEKADEKMDGGHAFRTMAAYEQWLLRDGGDEGRREVAVLRLMGLFDRPAAAGCLHALLQPPAIPGLTEPLVGVAEDDWEFCLTGLESARLLTVNRDASGALVSLDAHPHLREYFAKQLRKPTALQAPTGRNMSAQGNALGSSIPIPGSPEGAIQGAEVSPLQGLGVSGVAVPGALPQAVMSRPVGAPDSAETSDAWRAAHRRLYEHLCASTKEGDAPTLEDLQPLYQAVAHGCQAGLQQKAYEEVHLRRIRRWDDYAVHKLGAFGAELGALACFFERVWSKPSDALKEQTQSILLNNVAFRLQALGRLIDAIEPMRVSGEMDAKVEEWRGVAQSYSNLSELELTLGEVAGAVGDAEQSVTYADRSGNADWPQLSRTTHADALHQAGRRAEAETRFREAEQMQQERQPDYPLLYGLAGFQYCDLLLAAPERVAWQAVLGRRASVLECGGLPPLLSAGRAGELPGTPIPAQSGSSASASPPHSKTLRDVRERAAKTLKWISDYGRDVLSPSLDHLTPGRAALYEAILQGGAALPRRRQAGPQPGPTDVRLVTSAATELDAAVSGLRRAGDSTRLPHGLLTRAWLRFLTGAYTGPESAQADLDEAWEIAERGPMKLFMADIHLSRARLFGRQKAEGRRRNAEVSLGIAGQGSGGG